MNVTGNPRPIVDDASRNAFSLALCGNFHAATFADGVDRVLEQIRPDLIQLIADRRNVREIGRDLESH